MNYPPFRAKRAVVLGALAVISIAFLLRSFHAHTPPKKTATLSTIQQELVRTETGFFEAWKMKDQVYFREHIAENGIFWGEAGTFSRDQQLQEQEASAKVCKVDGYGLSDFAAMPVAEGAYLLTYKAEQYATCNGEKVPVHMNGSSIYVLKAGRWQAVYRAEVPLKSQS
jgi:hypothetical protein